MNRYNLEAEKDLLSVILSEPTVLIEFGDKFRKELFFDPFHIKVVNKIRDLTLKEVPVEISTITNSKKEQTILHEIKLRGKAPEFFKVFYSILEQCLIARHLDKINKQLDAAFHNDTDDKDPSELLHKLKSQLEVLEQARSSSISTASELIETVVDRHLEVYADVQAGKEVVHEGAVITPYPSLNNLLRKSGLSGGDGILIAAPTSTGKTEFALNLGSYAALEQNKKVFIYSLEMDKESLMERILLARSKIDSYKLERGEINQVDITKLKVAAKDIKNSSIYFDENLSGDIFDIITSIRKTHQKYGLDLVIIDYIQLIKYSTKQASNRNEELTSISRILKREAVRLGIPFLVLSQLSRRHLIENREPANYDLRDSGSLEQDADLIIFLYCKQKESKNKIQSKTKCIISKQRSGTLGEFYLMNNKTIQTFTEIGEVEYLKTSANQRNKNNETEEDDDLPF